MDRYQVVAPYVTVPTMTQRGQQVIGLIKGAFVPEDAPSEWVARHLRKKLIEKLPGAEPAPAPAPSGEGEQKPERKPDDGAPAAPPESGPGSGHKAWIEYAVVRGMDRDEAVKSSRDDLIAALREG